MSKHALTLYLFINTTLVFSQDNLPLIISDDEKYILLFESRLSDIPDGVYINLYDIDSLYEPLGQFILKDDSVFTMQSSFSEQIAHNFHFNGIKKYDKIYDTLSFIGLCNKYHFDHQALLFPRRIEFKLDTLEYFKRDVRTSENYYEDPYDTIDLSLSASFEYKYIFKNIVLHNDTLLPNEGKILNDIENYLADLYIDKKRGVYFLNTAIEVREHEESKETYEIYSDLYIFRYKYFGKIIW